MISIESCREISEAACDYFEGTLPGPERAAFEDHLRVCESCSNSLRRVREVRELMKGSMGSLGFSPDFSQRTADRYHTTAMGAEGIEVEEIEAPSPTLLDELQARMGAAPWWLISGSFHALLLLLITLIGMAILQDKNRNVVIVTDLAEKKKPDDTQELKEVDILKKPIPIEAPEESEEMPVVTHEEVEVAEVLETADDSDASDTFGEDGISDVFLGGSGTVAALGLGGGGGGAFGRPNGAGGRLRRAIRGGGGKATESAVDLALEWLARHQEADGHWDAKKYQSSHDTDLAETGLAVLAFLGAGHTDKVGKYRDHVTRGLKWIISCQQDNGHVHKGWRPGYTHPIASLALAEAYGMSRSDWLKEPAQKAVNYSTEIHQSGEGSERGGWRYKAKQAGDVSISCWFTMQLKSAKVAGLIVDPASFDGAIRFFDKVEKKGDDGERYSGHRYGYTSPRPQKKERWPVETMLGCTSRVYLGWAADELEGAVQWAAETHGYPKWGQPLCWYYWYYGTMVSFQIGGGHWKKWNQALKTTLLERQVKEGEHRGSWTPEETSYSNYKHSSRVYCTAMGALCLEVYYRYLPLYR